MMPLTEPSSLAKLINLLKLSAIRRNRKGDKGKPCLKPLEALKNPKGVPLMSTTNELMTHNPRSN
jgi:hypothetical protein